MAVIKRGILGGFSGRVANVVGSSWKGIAVMKALPLSVANPQTAAQTRVRKTMRDISNKMSVILTEIVKPLWDRFAQQMSGYNFIIQSNIDEWDDGVLLIPANFRASVGSLTNVTMGAVVVTAASDDVQTSWTDNSGTGNALATDKVYITIFNETQNVWEGFADVAVRSDATITVTTQHDIVGGDTIYSYVSLARVDLSSVSTSVNGNDVA